MGSSHEDVRVNHPWYGIDGKEEMKKFSSLRKLMNLRLLIFLLTLCLVDTLGVSLLMLFPSSDSHSEQVYKSLPNVFQGKLECLSFIRIFSKEHCETVA